MKKGDIIELQIVDMAFGGKGIARIPTDKGDYVIFVPNSIPGQKVKAKLKKKRSKYGEANPIEVLERSQDEIDVPYQQISGAPFLHLPLEKQHEYKLKTTLDQYIRIAGVDDAEERLEEFIPSPSTYHYRNKMEYSFSAIGHDIYTDKEFDGFALGFKRRGTWWKVENLDKDSGLFDKAWEDGLKTIREYCESTGLPAWHPPRKEGFFRHIVVRRSLSNDKFLVNLITTRAYKDKFNPNEFLEVIKNILGDRLAGFTWVMNDDVADRQKIEKGTSRLIYGDNKIDEELLGLKFEMSMESFFQPNPKSAEKLYSRAIEYAVEDQDLSGKVLMDLFCGTGTIGQILAANTGAEVIGVDIVEEAIIDAKQNAERNGIDGLSFFADDAGKFILHHPEYKDKIATIVMDPPRAGIAPKTLRKVIRLNAPRIVYVSCNPSTQARDTQTLREGGYDLIKFSLVDQFPHTSHIESVAIFQKVRESQI